MRSSESNQSALYQHEEQNNPSGIKVCIPELAKHTGGCGVETCAFSRWTTICSAICVNCFIGDENAKRTFNRLKSNAGALTNFEVLDFLRSRGATKDPTRVMNSIASSEFKVFDYLVESACCNQTRECINVLFDKCKNYNLAPAEILNIINIRPSSVVEIDPIIEQCESRFGEGIQDLVDLVTEVLPPPPSEPKPDEGVEEDEGEAQENEAEE
ncbi:RNA polymerase subunit Rpb4/RPC9 [Dillenia turbinata]|uniref:DNA-directed RNA polymerase III subunit RPC9 n=1 Tax=Dillenia turbinata TaxID=194707 RepID=A0AAN8ZUA0_9MAGN